MKKTILFGAIVLSIYLPAKIAAASGTLAMSQSSVSLSSGQSIVITANSTSNQTINLTSDTNSFVAYANVSGNQITIYGLGSGNTNMTFCTFDNTCASVQVTVSGTTNNNGSLTFSQSNISLTNNQTTTVTAYNSNNINNNSIYISSNSNSSIASAYVSGNSINLTGLNSGSTTINVCAGNLQCGSLYVTVNGNNNNSQISFSQNNVSLNTNQTQIISVYNSNGSIYISNNSNSNVVSAFVSGSSINLSGMTSGSSTITVCGSGASCNYLNVTVNGSSTGQIGFSQTNVSMNINDYTNVTVYNSSDSALYLSNNSNSSVVSASLSGNLISLHAINSGSSTITICGSSVACGSLYVTVSGSNNGQITFSTNNVNLSTNQIQSVYVYNSNGSIYISNNSNSNVVSAFISGTSVSLTGINSGSSTITVCSSNSTCGYLYVTVGGSNNGQISFSPSSVNMNVNQSMTVSIYSNNSFNSSYYISSNSNPNILTANISGLTMNLYALNYGTANIIVCQSNNQCGTLSVTVGFNNNSGNIYFTTTTLPQPALNQYYSYQFNVTGGTAPYTFTLSSGSLSTGLVLATSGQIYGTPTSSYTSSFVVKANDYYNNTGLSQTFNLTPTTGTVAGALIYNNGTLLNDNGTIYITYKNTKSSFANSAAFTGLGYSFANAGPASSSALAFSGFTIGTSNIAHPWGSWIKNGTTIYFVHDQGRIPISSMDVFINNGGILQNVVNANIYDLAKPLQTAMTMNDPRLQ